MATEIYFSQFWKIGKFKIKVPRESVSGEDPLPGLEMAFLSLSPHLQKNQGAPWDLSL